MRKMKWTAAMWRKERKRGLDRTAQIPRRTNRTKDRAAADPARIRTNGLRVTGNNSFIPYPLKFCLTGPGSEDLLKYYSLTVGPDVI
jgi:hypothetical protein